MVTHRMKKVVAGLATLVLVVACGKSIDVTKLPGTWTLERLEGVGSIVAEFRMENGQFSPRMGGRFDCSSPYRIEGNVLVAAANLQPGCRYAEFRIEIESVSATELVLTQNGARAIYRREGSSSQPRYR